MGSNDELVAAGKAGCIAHCACPDDADVGCILATGPGLLYTGSLRKRQKLVSNVHVLQGAMMAGCTFGMAGRGLSSVPSRLTRTLSTLLQRTPACHTWQRRALRTKCGSGAPTALRRACLRTSLNKSGEIRRASPTGPILQSHPGCLILRRGVQHHGQLSAAEGWKGYHIVLGAFPCNSLSCNRWCACAGKHSEGPSRPVIAVSSWHLAARHRRQSRPPARPHGAGRD